MKRKTLRKQEEDFYVCFLLRIILGLRLTAGSMLVGER